jgi:hypothetical protein
MEPMSVDDTFPTTARMKRRWLELAKAIAAAAGSTSGADPQGPKGTLTILGSGIAHSDLSIEVEKQLREADHVFYSINDYVTKTWLNALRPDAYDMAILYNEALPRRATYTRMAEALLHYVRRGKKVVAVFYGHPGVFAAPGHRAIQIARKEGHSAQMRPAVSALDCLVADIGFDPGLPGMLAYEATDMLLRRRRLDPTLHTILWQVGVVGEAGYNRSGYANRGLGMLVDVLEQVYGIDYEIVHYVGAQYVSARPLIERLPIGSLRAPGTARKLSTLSTFYLPPLDLAETDAERAMALGLPLPRTAPSAPRGDLTRYGPGEIDTLRRFADLSFASGYAVPDRSAVLAFLTALSGDMGMRRRFESDPAAVLDGPDGIDLTEREKSLLLARDQRAFVAAIQENAAA